MNRHFFLGIVSFGVAITASVGALLVYDPVTNSYIQSGATVTTTGTVTTGTVTTGTVTGTITGTVALANSGATTGKTIITYSIPDPSTYKGSLSAMHVQLDAHTKAVIEKLQTHVSNLDISKSASLQEAADHLRTLTCLGIVSPTTNIYDVLQNSATNLKNSIEIVRTDMHGDISSLEEKISKGLLDRLIQQLEISSMQNKIDSFKSEYTNVVDLFFEVSIGEVETVEQLFTNLSPEAKKNLETYNKTRTAYQSVMKAYETFLGKSSFANVVAGPYLHELISLTNGLKVYWRSVLLSERQAKVSNYAPAGTVATFSEQKKLLAQNFSLLFNEATQKVLGSLYPIDELLLLNQQIMGLRSAYTDESNGFADCRAFVENPTVLVTGPELEKYMTTLLVELNKAVNQVSTGNTAPKTKGELLSGLKKEIDAQAKDIVTSLISTHKAKIVEKLATSGRTLLSVSLNNSQATLEYAVRIYLQKKYAAALEAGTVTAFQDKLQTINGNIEKKLASGKLSTAQTKLLIIIEGIINEFLG